MSKKNTEIADVACNSDDTSRHPVWGVYDELRTARLNAKYCSAQLHELIMLNKTLDIIAAISTSSAVAGFSFWQTVSGGYVWKFLGVVATFVSISKPFVRLSDKIKEKQEALMGYNALDYDLCAVASDVQFYNKYDASMYQKFQKALSRKSSLMKMGADDRINPKLRDRCLRETSEELPLSSFFIPSGEK